MLEIADVDATAAKRGDARARRAERAYPSAPAEARRRRAELDFALDRLSQAERRIARLTEQASLDELTGALRRGAGWDALVREIARVRRSVEPRLVVAFIDVDHLKRVNDSEGHAAGDRLIRAVADALRRRLRSYDLIIRWGGDEFVCVLPEADLEVAEAAMQSLSEQLLGAACHSFSWGLAALQPGDTAETILVRADERLYEGRAARRDR